jgi:hypothetical protein
MIECDSLADNIETNFVKKRRHVDRPEKPIANARGQEPS